jgi:aspartyl-tRNA(Asn)/glutamyl-tRNA(Gln) amidotransferase subunit B
MEEAGLNDYDSMVLTLEKETADYFEAAWKSLGSGQEEAKLTANWVMTEVLRLSNEQALPLSRLPISPDNLASLCRLLKDGKASNQAGRKVFKHMVETGDSAEKALDLLGLAQISDPKELEPLVQKVIDNSKKAVKDYFKGKKKALDAMKGGVMRETRGRANPGLVSEILLRLLEKLKEE